MLKNSDYSNYKVQDYLEDPMFQDWILHPDSENEQFWQGVMHEYPQQKEIITSAKLFLTSIKFQEYWPSDQQVENAFEKSLQKIKNNTQPVQIVDIENNTKSIRKFYWVAAASIIAIVGIGIWFFKNQSKTNEPLLVQQNSVQDVLPGGDKAVLTLADGSQVVLDAANNGAVAQQGDVKVIKLDDGQISYKGNGNKTQVLYNTISTPKGGQYQLVLADGTKVWLNAASSLRFPTAFVEKERKVTLTGEGYFEVVKNAQHPFVVQADKIDVKVLGTHFNVNAYPDEDKIATTLLQGAVQLKSGNSEMLLSPGQQAQLTVADNQLKKINNVNVDEVMAWKEGKFLFKGMDLEAILRQASRWYDVDFEYQGKIDETFSGGIARSENISELLKILAATDKIAFKINGRKILVQQK